jgi:hypothetical protein
MGLRGQQINFEGLNRVLSEPVKLLDRTVRRALPMWLDDGGVLVMEI